MKFCKRLLLATTAISLTLLLSVAGSAQAQQRCQTDAEDASTGQVKVLCRRCQAPGCNFLEKEWEVNLTK